jgi:hypothetical protein
VNVEQRAVSVGTQARLERGGGALGAGLIVVATVLLVRRLAPGIFATTQAARDTLTAPRPPEQREASWTETREIQRLDALAGVVLQTALGAVIAGVTIAGTVSGLPRSMKWLLLAGAVVSGLAGTFALFALSYSPLHRPLAEIVEKKEGRTRASLWLLAGAVEAVGAITVIVVFPRL